MFFFFGRRIEREVERITANVLGTTAEQLQKIRNVTDLTGRVDSLQGELATLRIAKSKIEEDFARREREIEHKVGLERKRQEVELVAGKREAVVSVREENLKADQTRFAETMKFQNDRFTTEVGYLKDMIEQMMNRLPSAEILATSPGVRSVRVKR